jgi:hypothetical protein
MEAHLVSDWNETTPKTANLTLAEQPFQRIMGTDMWLPLLVKKLIIHHSLPRIRRDSIKEINASEGFRRLATVFRWLGDGLAVLCFLAGVFINEGNVTMFIAGIVFGAFCSGVGRTISWVLLGFAK